MVEDKYVGLALAMISSVAIGSSFVITKKGLNQASDQEGFDGDGFRYLKNPTWWGGLITMVVGEVANFAAYAFAPAILVTPLGALSVLIGSVLGTYFLDEILGILGKIGCALCLIGSVVIVLHAPADRNIESMPEMLHYAVQPGFLFYSFAVAIFAVVMIYQVAPRYGRKNPLIYLSICSTVGSISVMAIKAFGLGIRLTLRGDNQFVHAATYVFVILVAVCVLVQLNYFNKALSQFSTNIVNPLYYVTFTTATIVASIILFGGFNTENPVNTLSLLCGFLVIFTGVYLLNLSRNDPDGQKSLGGNLEDGVPTDGLAGFQTRSSMQLRRSSQDSSHHHHRSLSDGSLRGFAASADRADRQRLMHTYDSHDHSAQYSLDDLAEESEDDDGNGKRTSFDDPNGRTTSARGVRNPPRRSSRTYRSR